MKRKKFCWFLLIASWIIFVATERSIGGTILLIIAGLYAMIDAVCDIKRRGKQNDD